MLLERLSTLVPFHLVVVFESAAQLLVGIKSDNAVISSAQVAIFNDFITQLILFTDTLEDVISLLFFLLCILIRLF